MAIQAVLPVLLPALASILQSKEVAMAGNKLINGMLDIFRPVGKCSGHQEVELYFCITMTLCVQTTFISALSKHLPTKPSTPLLWYTSSEDKMPAVFEEQRN